MRAPGPRRRLVAALTGALLLTGATLAQPTAAAPAPGSAERPDAERPDALRQQPVQPPRVRPGWQLRWAPQASRTGLRAFEHAEDDRAGSHPAAAPHIRVQDGAYRFDMHLVDRDTSTDRQRHEVRGARVGDRTLTLLKGETWRFTYAMYIPSSLRATTTFTHIMQMKMPGTGSGPIVVMSLRRYGDVPKIELKAFETDTLIGAVDLAPLQDRWISVDFQMGIGDAPDGWLRWIVRDGRSTVIDARRDGVDTWLGDRVRPKWGVYRSLGDQSGSLADCYLLISGLRAYQWSGTVGPPRSNRHEAERAASSAPGTWTSPTSPAGTWSGPWTRRGPAPPP
jgi:hypothetical protein